MFVACAAASSTPKAAVAIDLHCTANLKHLAEPASNLPPFSDTFKKTI